VVAIGAAIQGAQLLLGSKSDILLLDVTPLSLGIETLGGVMTVMIGANTTIPTKKAETFTTAADNQPSVEVQVYQGERKMAADNRKIGEFSLDGIPPAPRSVPKIEVTFDIDANGILNVSARDQGTGKENKITIKNSSGLNQDEIDRMKRDAAEHADEDKKRRELVDARNKADQMVFTVEKTLKESGDKVREQDKAPIQSAIERVKETAKGDDVAAIERAIGDLEQSLHAMSQHLYGQAGGPSAAGGPPSGDGGQSGGGGKGGDDVIDAEYEVKK
jgi:molecular chaperone DnaK